MNKYQIKSRNDVNNILHEFSSHELRLLKQEFGFISDDALITSILEYEDIKNKENNESVNYDMIAISSRLHDILENIPDHIQTAKTRKTGHKMTQKFDDTKIATMMDGFRKAGMTSEEINQAINAVQANSKVVVPTKSINHLDIQSIKNDTNVTLTRTKVQKIVSDIIQSHNVINLRFLFDYFRISWINGETETDLIRRITQKVMLNNPVTIYPDRHNFYTFHTYSDIEDYLNTIILNATTKLHNKYPTLPTSIAYVIDEDYLQVNSDGSIDVFDDGMMTFYIDDKSKINTCE